MALLRGLVLDIGLTQAMILILGIIMPNDHGFVAGIGTEYRSDTSNDLDPGNNNATGYRSDTSNLAHCLFFLCQNSANSVKTSNKACLYSMCFVEVCVRALSLR